MITSVIYNEKIDLKHTNLIYQPKEKACMSVLKEIYINRCFKGSYILDIDNIIKISDVIISPYHLDVRGIVWITFVAKVIRYIENDLISDCKIVRKKDKVFANTKYGNIIILDHEILRLLKEGDYLPIIVKKTAYKPLEKNISIFAFPFIPSVSLKSYMYIITKSLSNQEIDKLKYYINEIKNIKNLIKNFKSEDTKKFKAFDELFYPYKTQKKPSLFNIKNHIKLLDFISINYDNYKKISSVPTIIIPCSEINLSQSFVLSADIKSKDIIEKRDD